jgi:hypothetical protein
MKEEVYPPKTQKPASKTGIAVILAMILIAMASSIKVSPFEDMRF